MYHKEAKGESIACQAQEIRVGSRKLKMTYLLYPLVIALVGFGATLPFI